MEELCKHGLALVHNCHICKLEEDNKRYREALEEIAKWDKMLYSPREMGNFAKNALGLAVTPLDQ